jgi:hypothetical protein
VTFFIPLQDGHKYGAYDIYSRLLPFGGVTVVFITEYGLSFFKAIKAVEFIDFNAGFGLFEEKLCVLKKSNPSIVI